MCRVGKPVSSLLSFLTLQVNIMTIQSKKIAQALQACGLFGTWFAYPAPVID